MGWGGGGGEGSGASKFVLSDDQIKAEDTGRMCSTNGVHKKCMKSFSRKSGRNRLLGILRCRCEDYISAA
jgi:hypothetical protein